MQFNLTGGNLSVHTVLIIGISCVIADGLAMGVGEYQSSKAHNKYVQAERRREQYDYKNYREEGVGTLIRIFTEKGMTQDDAELVVNKMSQYENLFVNFMITEGKGLLIPEDTEYDLCADSGTMFLSFAFFGSVPMISIYICACFGIEQNINYAIALAVTMVLLLLFGFIKSTFW
jgi:VIT1/CCC1 family predicted Fe2+/Mn2+ transporter